MSEKIDKLLPTLLDAYLDELKAEAETVAHIAKFLEKSAASRAELSEQLKSNLTALKSGTPEKAAIASPSPPAEIGRDDETTQEDTRAH